MIVGIFYKMRHLKNQERIEKMKIKPKTKKNKITEKEKEKKI